MVPNEDKRKVLVIPQILPLCVCVLGGGTIQPQSKGHPIHHMDTMRHFPTIKCCLMHKQCKP